MRAEQLTMSACPHDTAGQPERWFALAQQLSLASGVSVRFSLALDFPEFRSMLPELDLVYANPNDALHLVTDLGFAPLARGEGRFDEAVLVCRREDPRNLAAAAEKPVASCLAMIVTDVALRWLASQGLAAPQLVDHPSWGACLASLFNGQTDLAILYADFYHSLRPETQEKLLLLGSSQEQKAFHCFLLAPHRGELQETLRSALLRLHENPHGAAALKALGFPKLVPTSREEVLGFASLRT